MALRKKFAETKPFKGSPLLDVTTYKRNSSANPEPLLPLALM
jgi:hypothetical protein